ncbi:PucR family transcriptional regulator [Paenibacillus thermoaerophilus]|uniref:PucR family transcriptional regulator n=1 Tax=Paenibacillus thermoaerophilus TaxID=1215385 RepID=A0ABW2V5V7_9BACL|nr:helix-turn-helix domain-containing protein [Paenibacillus thermoaerophilus]TMV08389.1 PucR family transcriptional regulator [Paenibacillus thermoaerophilus]
MSWENLRSKLGDVWNIKTELVQLPVSEWNEKAGNERHVWTEDGCLVYLGREDGCVHALLLVGDRPTHRELKLLEAAAEACRQQPERRAASGSEEERRAHRLRDWIDSQLELGITNAELPDLFSSSIAMQQSRIPFLIYGEHADSRRIGYTELKKLLETFFQADVALIPLSDREWLILSSDLLLNESEAEWGEGEAGLEEALLSIGEALHEMMASESVGECQIALSYPILPAKSLLWAVAHLRETLLLGRQYRMGRSVHVPWMLHLERMVSAVPDSDKLEYLNHVLRGSDRALDTETLTTLEAFFEMDCNVSETAKKLYIHRNTLLYRLDKFKQETGLDVRAFRHAVLVHMAILLYKVTKRK